MNIINTKNIYITINIFFWIHTCRRCLTPPLETTSVAVTFFIKSGEIFFPFKTIFIIVSLPSSESVIHSPPLEFRNMFLTACTCSERRVGSIVVAEWRERISVSSHTRYTLRSREWALLEQYLLQPPAHSLSKKF